MSNRKRRNRQHKSVHNFELDNEAPIATHGHCDKCGGHDCVSTWANGNTFCHQCGHKSTGDGEKLPVPTKPKRSDNYKRLLPVDHIEGVRGLTNDTCDKFGIHHHEWYFREFKREVSALIFNYFDERGAVVAQKAASLERLPNGDKAVTTAFGKPYHFFGTKSLRNADNNSRVYVCEGEIDAATVWQVLGANKHHHVLSVPSGAANAFNFIKRHRKMLNRFKEVVFCFDMDDAGKKAREACMPLFGPKAYYVELPKHKETGKQFKDPNEMLTCVTRSKDGDEQRPHVGDLITALVNPTPYDSALPAPNFSQLCEFEREGRVLLKANGYEVGDSGNAQRILDRHGKNLKIMEQPVGFAYWVKNRWKLNADLDVRRMATNVLADMKRKELPKMREKFKDDHCAVLNELNQQRWEDEDDKANAIADAREQYVDALKACEQFAGMAKTADNTSKVKNALDAIIGNSTEDLCVEGIGSFDQQRTLLNCQNGVVDLKTGQLLRHSRDYLMSRITNCDYKPDAKAPTWEHYLETVSRGDQDIKELLSLMLGWSITGDISDQKYFFLVGSGSDGKTTLAETMKTLLGDYAGTLETSLLVGKDSGEGRALEQQAALRGIRLAITSEVGEADKLNAARIKKICGGDTLRGTSLHKDSWMFRPTHHVVWLVNALPSTTDFSHGNARRIVPIPFNAKFNAEDGTRNFNMEKELCGELEGILAYLVRYAKKVLDAFKENRDPFKFCTDGNGNACYPKAVMEKLDEYWNSNDIYRRFISDCYIKDVNEATATREVYADHKQWCLDTGERFVSLDRFTQRMKERGYVIQKQRLLDYTNPVSAIVGIRKRRPDELEEAKDPYC